MAVIFEIQKEETTGYNQLSPKQIQNLINSMDASQYLKNQAYYEGDNIEIIKYAASKEKTPNNKIPLPFARKTVNDIVGYSGKPGLIQYVLAAESSPASVEEYNKIVKESNLWLTTAEVYQDANVKGEGAELAWTGKDGLLYFTKIPREQCQFFYSDTVDKELQYSVRSYKQRQVKADGNPTDKYFAEVYWLDHVDYYEGAAVNQNKLQYDPQQGEENYAGNRYVEWTLVKTDENLLNKVMLYPYELNADKKGSFQTAIPIIDRLDMFGSDSIANSLDRFNDSILTLSKKIDKETAAKIKEMRVIDDLGTEGDFVKFVSREMDMMSSVEGFNLFERLYYELTSTINMTDDKFNQKSGIAIAYALVPFENLIAQYETYFNKGLEYRFSIINAWLVLTSKQELNYTIRWGRNLPFDLANRIDIIVKLKQFGVLSDETLLKLFPEDIITDADEEIKRIKAEKEENFQAFKNMAEAQTAEPQIGDADDDTI